MLGLRAPQTSYTTGAHEEKYVNLLRDDLSANDRAGDQMGGGGLQATLAALLKACLPTPLPFRQGLNWSKIIAVMSKRQSGAD